MRLFFLFFVASISQVLGVTQMLENPICFKPQKTIEDIYGYIRSHDFSRTYENPRIQQWSIGELCVGPLKPGHRSPNWETLSCICEGISLVCTRPASVVERFYNKELFPLCNSRCTCNAKHKDLDPYDNVVRAARKLPPLFRRPEPLSEKIKKKLGESYGAASTYIKDKCKKRCDGAAACLLDASRGECGGSVCRVEGESPFGRCEPLDLSNWEAGSAGLANLASLSNLPGRRKRNVQVNLEQRLCACNTTYVSQACCLTETGLVWEAEGAKGG